MSRPGPSGDDELAFLPEVLASAPALVGVVDADNRIRFISRALEGLSLASMIGRDAIGFAHPDDRARVRAALDEARALGVTVRYRSRTTTDARLVLDNWASPIAGEEGALVLVALDATELVRVESAAESATAKLKLAVEAADMGLFELDLVAGRAQWDERMWAIHGRGPTHQGHRYIETYVHPEDRARAATLMARALSGEAIQPEYRILHPDGEPRWLRMSVIPIAEDGNVVRFVGGIIDVTRERLELERRQRAQHLEALGTLTAGVAHNFNNLMMVLVAIFEELSEILPTHGESISDGVTALRRGRQMVTSLLDFAGPRVHERNRVRLDELLRRAVRLCEQTFSAAIAIRTRIDGPLWVIGAESALEQIVMNLLLNARDALEPAGGAILVEAAQTDDAVVVRVVDDGPGIPKELQPTIFDPFVTTKGEQNTGLGLATALTIAREHDGGLEVESEPGEGATFTLTLPSVDAS